MVQDAMFYHPGKGPLESKITFSYNFMALGLCRGGIQDQVINLLFVLILVGWEFK